MEITKRFEQETDKAWQKFKAGEGKYYEGYADAFDMAEQIYKEEVELNERKWERMTNPYGALEGFLCPCGHSSDVAWDYCPKCGARMYGGEKNEN